MSEQDISGPGVKFPPPLMFVLSMVAAYGVHRFYPMEFSSATDGLYLMGSIVALIGLLVIVAANSQFKKAQTNIEPWKPSTQIVDTGLFRFSRNPIYLAFIIIQLGVAFMLNSYWLIWILPLPIFLVWYFAIKKEERYLQEKFGEPYRQYQQRVRRWI